MAVIAASLFLAFALRFDFAIPQNHLGHLTFGLAVMVAAKLVAFLAWRQHRAWWRYVTLDDAMTMAKVNLAGSVLGGAVIYLAGPAGFPRSIYLLDFVLCLVATGGMRVCARLLLQQLRAERRGGERKRVVIYGAGDAGMLLAREILQNPVFKYEVLGFIDDDRAKLGGLVHGRRVLGAGSELPALATKLGIELVLIAAPSATGDRMTQIIEHCLAAGVEYKTMPPLGQVMESSGLLGQMREVSVEDVLGRSPTQLDLESIRARIAGKRVLVTGAAGSIGSELCRQIARLEPLMLVGLDAAETPLFFLERELAEAFPGVQFEQAIGNVQNRARLDDVFGKYGPETVFHAAAYKHVPMMEASPFEAIENNVMGTVAVAECARDHGTADFVMISTDKAVRPTSVMGATKRLAEMAVRGMQNGGTRFISVRFGNVLGSNGSVIPIFKQQIAAGGPVTVTHPEMRRYFMTIPEASQLVLQAFAQGHAGEILVLDMGEAVKIADLARKLIILSGLQPERDVKIQFTGLRPGEKMYEELSMFEEGTLPTAHEKIRVFAGQKLSEAEVEAMLGELKAVCRARDLSRMVLVFKRYAADYNPSSELLQRAMGVWPRNP